MVTAFIILAVILILGIAIIAILPAAIGAAAPTAIAVAVTWIIYRFIRKGLKKVRDITK